MKDIKFSCCVCGRDFKLADMFYNPLRGNKPYTKEDVVNSIAMTNEYGERICKYCFPYYQKKIKENE